MLTACLPAAKDMKFDLLDDTFSVLDFEKCSASSVYV